MPVKRTGDIRIGLRRITPEMEQALRPVIEAVAELVQRDAQVSITTGAVSGKAHVPSAPGTPPNNDTGGLADGIVVEKVNALRCRVVSTSVYGAIQELGGSTGTATLPERPYMRPAGIKNKENGRRLMKAAVARVVKGDKV